MHCSGGTAVEERRAVERNQEGKWRQKNSWWVMVKFVPNHHGNHVIVSYTKNKGGGWEAPEVFYWETIWESEGLVWIILTSEAVSISVKQVEKSGIKDAGVNTGVIPKSDWHDGKEKAWHSPTLPKLKKKKTFQERKYLTKMQCWIIQCDVSPQIFRKILYTKSMVVCMWVCGEGQVRDMFW